MRWLLKAHDHTELVEQLDKVKVISKCGCGCTIDLHADDIENIPGNLHLSAQAVSPENVLLDVILHVRNGVLAELEIYAVHDTKDFTLPEVDKLSTY